MKRPGRIVKLICCCCGCGTRGRQWHNRDTGYGLCPDCADLISKKEAPDEMRSCYGTRGIHYDLPEERKRSTYDGGDPLFMGKYPCGILYADRREERHGDYRRLAFLPYNTLELEWSHKNDLQGRIEEDSKQMQAMRGELYQISTCGQTVRLGKDKK